MINDLLEFLRGLEWFPCCEICLSPNIDRVHAAERGDESRVVTTAALRHPEDRERPGKGLPKAECRLSVNHKGAVLVSVCLDCRLQDVNSKFVPAGFKVQLPEEVAPNGAASRAFEEILDEAVKDDAAAA